MQRIIVTTETIAILDTFYTLPAVLRCDCGNFIDLSENSNPCDKCYRIYSKTGHRIDVLPPPLDKVDNASQFPLRCETCNFRGVSDVCRECKNEMRESLQR